MTKTYARMPVTPAAYTEVRAALEAAGYLGHVEFGDCGRLLMDGIALEPNTATTDAEFAGPARTAQVVLSNLTPDQRLEAMRAFCRYCGTDSLPCHCMNDE